MNRIKLYALTAIATLAIGLSSCGEDRSGEYRELTQKDRWIEQQMHHLYLWYQDMPEVTEENYFNDPEEFFKKLLSKKCRNGKGDIFSYFENTALDDTATENSLSIDEKSSYGFDFVVYTDPTGTSAHRMGRVLLVLPDSPAEQSGLKRGDWITRINGNNLTEKNAQLLLKGGDLSLTLADLALAKNDEGTHLQWVNERPIKVGPSRQVTNNPFYLYEVLSGPNEKRIGYLMYDQYLPGTDTDKEKYSNQMKQIFADFKSKGVNEFILDLRYNRGGIMSCITELCSYLAPVSHLGSPLYSLEYNDKNSDKNGSIHLNSKLATENLNLSTLYVITSNYTASASESTIFCLKPYMDVKVIGNITMGKNVASQGLVSPYDFTLHPIVATIYDSKHNTYETGIQPDYYYDEIASPTHLGVIGDPLSDVTLAYAVEWVINGSLNLPVEQDVTRTAIQKLNPILSTLTDKKGSGIQITE